MESNFKETAQELKKFSAGEHEGQGNMKIRDNILFTANEIEETEDINRVILLLASNEWVAVDAEGTYDVDPTRSSCKFILVRVWRQNLIG